MVLVLREIGEARRALKPRRRAKRLKLRGFFAVTDQNDDFAESYIDVYESQAAERAAEIGVIPQILKVDFIGREQAGEVIQRPGVQPGKYHQESTDFKGEDREQNHPKTPSKATYAFPASHLSLRRGIPSGLG